MEIDADVLLEYLHTGVLQDRDVQILGLEQLCMGLLMSDNVDRCFDQYPPRKFLPVLCSIFMDEHATPSVLEPCARAITYYLDVSNDCSKRITQVPDAIKAMCSRLDTAEMSTTQGNEFAQQVIKMFQLMCVRDSVALYEAGCLSSVLSFVRDHAHSVHRDTITSAMDIVQKLSTRLEPGQCLADDETIRTLISLIIIKTNSNINTSAITSANDSTCGGNPVAFSETTARFVSHQALQCYSNLISRFARRSTVDLGPFTTPKLLDYLLDLLKQHSGGAVVDGSAADAACVCALLQTLCCGSAKITKRLLSPCVELDVVTGDCDYDFLQVISGVMRSTDEKTVAQAVRLMELILLILCEGRQKLKQNTALTAQLTGRPLGPTQDYLDMILSGQLKLGSNISEMSPALLHAFQQANTQVTSGLGSNLFDDRLPWRRETSHCNLITAVRNKDMHSLVNAIETGAFDVNYTDEVGQTLLNWATAFGSLTMVWYLCERGADVNKGELSPSLHYAARFGRPDIASLLLRYGADVNLRDKEGKSAMDKALEVADSALHKRVVEILNNPKAALENEAALQQQTATTSSLNQSQACGAPLSNSTAPPSTLPQNATTVTASSITNSSTSVISDSGASRNQRSSKTANLSHHHSGKKSSTAAAILDSSNKQRSSKKSNNAFSNATDEDDDETEEDDPTDDDQSEDEQSEDEQSDDDDDDDDDFDDFDAYESVTDNCPTTTTEHHQQQQLTLAAAMSISHQHRSSKTTEKVANSKGLVVDNKTSDNFASGNLEVSNAGLNSTQVADNQILDENGEISNKDAEELPAELKEQFLRRLIPVCIGINADNTSLPNKRASLSLLKRVIVYSTAKFLESLAHEEISQTKENFAYSIAELVDSVLLVGQDDVSILLALEITKELLDKTSNNNNNNQEEEQTLEPNTPQPSDQTTINDLDNFPNFPTDDLLDTNDANKSETYMLYAHQLLRLGFLPKLRTLMDETKEFDIAVNNNQDETGSNKLQLRNKYGGVVTNRLSSAVPLTTGDNNTAEAMPTSGSKVLQKAPLLSSAIKIHIYRLVQELCNKHLEVAQASLQFYECLKSDSSIKLRLLSQIVHNYRHKSFGEVSQAMFELAKMIRDDKSTTAYEIISSGLVQALLSLLQPSMTSNNKGDEVQAKCIALFGRAFSSCNEISMELNLLDEKSILDGELISHVSHTQCQTSGQFLIRKLVLALEQVEKLPVIQHRHFRGLSALQKVINIYLEKGGLDGLNDLNGHYLRAEPMLLVSELQTLLSRYAVKRWYDGDRGQLAFIKNFKGPRDFKFESDFDHNGVIYWLGSNGGLEKEWINPSRVGVGICGTMASSNNMDSYRLDCLLARDETNLSANNTKAVVTDGKTITTWIGVDLGLFLIPNAYSVRFMSTEQENRAKNWDLQASRDSHKWDTLIEHRGDEANEIKFSFVLDPNVIQQFSAVKIVGASGWRYFRIQQRLLGNLNNSNGKILITGLEFYGRVTEVCVTLNATSSAWKKGGTHLLRNSTGEMTSISIGPSSVSTNSKLLPAITTTNSTTVADNLSIVVPSVSQAVWPTPTSSVPPTPVRPDTPTAGLDAPIADDELLFSDLCMSYRGALGSNNSEQILSTKSLNSSAANECNTDAATFNALLRSYMASFTTDDGSNATDNLGENNTLNVDSNQLLLYDEVTGGHSEGDKLPEEDNLVVTSSVVGTGVSKFSVSVPDLVSQPSRSSGSVSSSSHFAEYMRESYESMHNNSKHPATGGSTPPRGIRGRHSNMLSSTPPNFSRSGTHSARVGGGGPTTGASSSSTGSSSIGIRRDYGRFMQLTRCGNTEHHRHHLMMMDGGSQTSSLSTTGSNFTVGTTRSAGMGASVGHHKSVAGMGQSSKHYTVGGGAPPTSTQSYPNLTTNPDPNDLQPHLPKRLRNPMINNRIAPMQQEHLGLPEDYLPVNVNSLLMNSQGTLSNPTGTMPMFLEMPMLGEAGIATDMMDMDTLYCGEGQHFVEDSFHELSDDEHIIEIRSVVDNVDMPMTDVHVDNDAVVTAANIESQSDNMVTTVASISNTPAKVCVTTADILPLQTGFADISGNVTDYDGEEDEGEEDEGEEEEDLMHFEDDSMMLDQQHDDDVIQPTNIVVTAVDSAAALPATVMSSEQHRDMMLLEHEDDMSTVAATSLMMSSEQQHRDMMMLEHEDDMPSAVATSLMMSAEQQHRDMMLLEHEAEEDDEDINWDDEQQLHEQHADDDVYDYATSAVDDLAEVIHMDESIRDALAFMQVKKDRTSGVTSGVSSLSNTTKRSCTDLLSDSLRQLLQYYRRQSNRSLHHQLQSASQDSTATNQNTPAATGSTTLAAVDLLRLYYQTSSEQGQNSGRGLGLGGTTERSMMSRLYRKSCAAGKASSGLVAGLLQQTCGLGNGKEFMDGLLLQRQFSDMIPAFDPRPGHINEPLMSEFIVNNNTAVKNGYFESGQSVKSVGTAKKELRLTLKVPRNFATNKSSTTTVSSGLRHQLGSASGTKSSHLSDFSVLDNTSSVTTVSVVMRDSNATIYRYLQEAVLKCAANPSQRGDLLLKMMDIPKVKVSYSLVDVSNFDDDNGNPTLSNPQHQTLSLFQPTTSSHSSLTEPPYAALSTQTPLKWTPKEIRQLLGTAKLSKLEVLRYIQSTCLPEVYKKLLLDASDRQQHSSRNRIPQTSSVVVGDNFWSSDVSCSKLSRRINCRRLEKMYTQFYALVNGCPLDRRSDGNSSTNNEINDSQQQQTSSLHVLQPSRRRLLSDSDTALQLTQSLSSLSSDQSSFTGSSSVGCFLNDNFTRQQDDATMCAQEGCHPEDILRLLQALYDLNLKYNTEDNKKHLAFSAQPTAVTLDTSLSDYQHAQLHTKTHALGMNLTPEEFYSRKLTKKLLEQLHDPLTLVCQALPDWCSSLPKTCPLLFPTEARLTYFYSTSFGATRSLLWLQNQYQVYCGGGPGLTSSGAGVGGTLSAGQGGSLSASLGGMGGITPGVSSTSTLISGILQGYNMGGYQNSFLDAANGGNGSHKTSGFKVGRLRREFVRINRQGATFYEEASQLLISHASRRAELEVQFINEEGTGIGPTLEFFSLLSNEFCRRDGGMWLTEDIHQHTDEQLLVEDDSEFNNTSIVSTDTQNEDKISTPDKTEQNLDLYVHIPRGSGLFPAPRVWLDEQKKQAVLQRFYCLGIALSKCLQDNRIVDIPLALSFFKILCQENSCQRRCFSDLFYSEELGSSFGSSSWITGLLDFSDFCEIYPDRAKLFVKLLELQRQGCWRELDILLEEVGLTMEYLPTSRDFVLQDQSVVLRDEYEWEHEGDFGEISVAANDNQQLNAESITRDNLNTYIRRHIEFCLDKGIRAQMNAFKRGFELVCPLDQLRVFVTGRQLRHQLCGEQFPNWTLEELKLYTEPKNGYTTSSPLYNIFLSVLMEMSGPDRRQFLRFATGCSALPPGGLQALYPRLTVVRKEGGDGVYPSVNTCAHYLKLPEYSSAELLAKRLKASAFETGFHLN